MLEHCVFCDILPDTPQERIDEIMVRLASLRGVVDGMLDFRAGPNRDYEAKTGRYSHGFICTFRDRAAHLAYDAHPQHKAAGADLVAICTGGYSGIIVFDLEIGDRLSR
jgi:hypothetical protein